MKKQIKCPICGKDTVFDQTNPYRPFCCERCRLIDLGEWAGEERRIAGENLDPEQIDSSRKLH